MALEIAANFSFFKYRAHTKTNSKFFNKFHSESWSLSEHNGALTNENKANNDDKELLPARTVISSANDITDEVEQGRRVVHC